MYDFLLSWGYPALFLLSFLAATVLPLGSEWLLVTLLSHGYAAEPVVLVATAGNTLGALTTWGLGMWGSDWLVQRVMGISTATREKAERCFSRWGSWALLLSWLPFVGDPLCLVAGVMNVPVVRFLLLVLLGKFLPYATVAGLFAML